MKSLSCFDVTVNDTTSYLMMVLLWPLRGYVTIDHSTNKVLQVLGECFSNEPEKSRRCLKAAPDVVRSQCGASLRCHA